MTHHFNLSYSEKQGRKTLAQNLIKMYDHNQNITSQLKKIKRTQNESYVALLTHLLHV